jgi:nicotinamide-nucleotide amidase
MFYEEVEPRLRALAGVSEISDVCEMKFTGIGESDFHHGIDAGLAATPGLEYGYCARMGEVDLRLIGKKEAISSARELVMERLSKYLISDDGSSLEATVIRLLKEKGMKVATAESCTGGLIANRLTNVPSASDVFTYGWVTYSNDAKVNQLHVPTEIIAEHGAVSEKTALAMAEGALKVSGADISVSVTGIAGPSGGTDEKPVGTAGLGIAESGKQTIAVKVFHPRSRKDFKQSVSQSALDLIRRRLLGV